MNLYISLRSELLKTKRTPAFWISVLGAMFIPAIFGLAYILKPESALRNLSIAPWDMHFVQGWQALTSFLFPMYIILICALIPQIEFRNNSWKQVFASPQSTAEIFFSKFISVHLMIMLFYVTFNLSMIGIALVTNIIHPKFPFFEKSIDWASLMRLNAKTYISIVGISAFQFWLSLRFKSFVAPVGIGLAVLVGGLVASGLRWDHVSKIPHAQPYLTLQSMFMGERPFLENHEWNSMGYMIFFLIVALGDLLLRKEKG